MEIGRIDKPKVEEFSGKRKIYCINHVFALSKNDEFEKLVDRYWQEADAHLQKLEIAGKVGKIFIEGITPSEDPLSAIKNVNENFYNLVKKRIEEGGKLVPLEENEIFSAYMDLRNCLFIVRTKEVYDKIFDYYREVAERRFENIKKIIEEEIKEGEAALLIMDDRERAHIEFPEDLEVFLVVPPAYDDIIKWIRKEGKA